MHKRARTRPLVQIPHYICIHIFHTTHAYTHTQTHWRPALLQKMLRLSFMIQDYVGCALALAAHHMQEMLRILFVCAGAVLCCVCLCAGYAHVRVRCAAATAAAAPRRTLSWNNVCARSNVYKMCYEAAAERVWVPERIMCLHRRDPAHTSIHTSIH